MLTGGILVGSAGTILTVAMCKAMNRPLSSVIFGAFGGGGAAAATSGTEGNAVKDMSITDLAVLMNYSKKVIIVPGYGLAVAQAQHVIHELEEILESRSVEVKYAIHPVAGRMPGHMNVLLAESNVSYDKLVEMEEVNPEFASTDVVLVVGANDVVNPSAKTDPSSPIYGMPILEVDQAQHIVINKRSMSAGYAGIDNPLFYHPKTSMVFGDAKGVLTRLVAELKQM
jgi:NAD(P) transhydrogenase subunit beta